MTDIFSRRKRSDVMSQIKGKNTGIELLVFRFLKKAGVRFVKHYGEVPGTPDLAIPERKIAVFVDGDFWHGYRYPLWMHKLKNKFWRDKIERNRIRDFRNHALLRAAGWVVIRVWEHQLRKNKVATLTGLARRLKKDT